MIKAADKLLEYLNALTLTGNGNSFYQYKMNSQDGVITLTGIINTSKKSVAEVHFSNKGMTSDWHSHDEIETFIKISGEEWWMEIKGEEDQEVEINNPVCIPSNKIHRVAKIGGEVYGLVILVPGNKSFPKGVK